MGLNISPESPLGRELDRWNRTTNQYDDKGTPGMRAPRYEEFPRMVYRAQRLPSGAVRCMEPSLDPRVYADPKVYERDLATLDQFNRGCWRIVRSTAEYEQAKSEGWRDSPADALAYDEALQQDIARAAAERAYADQRMSAKAQAEMAAAEANAEGQHLPEGPAVPAKRPWHRKPKPEPVTAD